MKEATESFSCAVPPLREWRKATRRTQEGFAREMEVAKDTVARWDRGEGNPHKSKWPMVQKVTGMSPREFLHINESINQEPDNKAAHISGSSENPKSDSPQSPLRPTRSDPQGTGA